MAGNMKGIVDYRRKQQEDAREKAENAIMELLSMGKAINFNSVSEAKRGAKNFSIW